MTRFAVTDGRRLDTHGGEHGHERDQHARSTNRPNILILCMDQWDTHMDVPDEVEFPAMERLEAQGVSFDRHYCTVPICTPSRATMWTGVHAMHTGAYGTTPTSPGSTSCPTTSRPSGTCCASRATTPPSRASGTCRAGAQRGRARAATASPTSSSGARCSARRSRARCSTAPSPSRPSTGWRPRRPPSTSPGCW